MKEYFAFPKGPGLEPHHQMQFVMGCVTPFVRCSLCILLPQLTGLVMIDVEVLQQAQDLDMFTGVKMNVEV